MRYNMTEENDKSNNKLNDLDKYINEYNNDVSYDRVSLEDVQLKLPAVKAKWIARLINAKKEYNQLQDILIDAIEKIADKIKKESPVGLTQPVVEKSAEKHELIKKIRKELKNQYLMIEFLEKSEKSIHTVTYDIKNSVDIIKSEQT